MSRVSTHAGQNRELCLTAHGRLPRTLQCVHCGYIHVTCKHVHHRMILYAFFLKEQEHTCTLYMHSTCMYHTGGCWLCSWLGVWWRERAVIWRAVGEWGSAPGTGRGWRLDHSDHEYHCLYCNININANNYRIQWGNVKARVLPKKNNTLISD